MRANTSDALGSSSSKKQKQAPLSFKDVSSNCRLQTAWIPRFKGPKRIEMTIHREPQMPILDQ
jgi:hypothetical protein